MASKMIGSRSAATFILGVATAGYLFSYPYSNSFGGGLLASACGAAMVGGIADWFAVTALFRRPLGIRWRTAIIPRNRKKVFNALTTMVQEELLTPNNITKTVSRYDMPALLLRYLNEHGGRENLVMIAARICRDLMEKLQPDDVSRMLSKIICGKAGQVNLAPAVAQGLEWSLRQGYDDKILALLLDELSRLAASREMKVLLQQFVTDVQLAYEHNLLRRQLLDSLLAGAGITAEQLAVLAQAGLVRFLQAMKGTEQPLRQQVKVWLAAMVEKMQTNIEFQQAVETWQVTLLKNRLDIRQPVADGFAWLRSKLNEVQGEQRWLEMWLGRQLDEMSAAFAGDAMQRQAVDVFVKNILQKWIQSYHSQIGSMVREKLSQFDDKMLVDFIEAKVGDDLQMIRINGAIVGGLAGVVLYLLQSLLLLAAGA